MPVCEALSACLFAVCQHVQHTGDVAGVAELRLGAAVNVAVLTLLAPELLQLSKNSSEGCDQCQCQEQHCDSEQGMASCEMRARYSQHGQVRRGTSGGTKQVT